MKLCKSPLFVVILFALPANAQRAVIEIENYRTVYIHVKTPLRILAEGKKADEVTAKASLGCSVFLEDGNWFLMADGSQRKIFIVAGFRDRNNDSIWTDTFYYRVRRLPDPEVLLGIRTPGEILTGELATVRQINAGYGEGFSYNGIGFTVLSYRIMCVDKNEFYTETHTGNKIPLACQARMRKPGAGGFIIIDHINLLNKQTNTETELKQAMVWHVNREHDPISFKPIQITGTVVNETGNVPFEYILGSCQFSTDSDIPNGYKDGEWNFYSVNAPESKARFMMVVFKHDTIQKITSYYPEGQLNEVKTYNYHTSEGQYIRYYGSGSTYLKGKFLIHDFPYSYNIIDDSFQFRKSMSLLCRQNGNKYSDFGDTGYLQVNELVFGPWDQYYPDGKLKQRGVFDTTFTNHWWVDQIRTWHDPDDPYANTKEDETTCFAVRQGLWEFYSDNGRKKTHKYLDGRLIR